MNKFKELKELLTNKEVVEKYLGLPVKSNSTGNWYKSPFRNERTASFCVSDKGIHDFGDSSHYDIISFVERYFRTDPKTAVEIIERDFNLSLGNEYETNETLELIKRNRQIEREAKERVNNWFNRKLLNICDRILINNKCLRHINKFHNSTSLKYLYDENSKLELEFETFNNVKEEDKPKLYLKYNRR